jgi:hypothetical protein
LLTVHHLMLLIPGFTPQVIQFNKADPKETEEVAHKDAPNNQIL